MHADDGNSRRSLHRFDVAAHRVRPIKRMLEDFQPVHPRNLGNRRRRRSLDPGRSAQTDRPQHHRQANRALHLAVISRIRLDPKTQVYVE
ncbi:putative transposase (plasmid) [Rhodococcus erythropolis PR4]|uniref:Putative transposase n=1 Tax=Rhodococcus erythropolis (strain PR4 / NBRC 100887) TaxID=234621 RepID=Q3L9J0_RHOE4|nr:putative transposase [Rhodococcus erythropolis PR4]